MEQQLKRRRKLFSSIETSSLFFLILNLLSLGSILSVIFFIHIDRHTHKERELEIDRSIYSFKQLLNIHLENHFASLNSRALAPGFIRMVDQTSIEESDVVSFMNDSYFLGSRNYHAFLSATGEVVHITESRRDLNVYKQNWVQKLIQGEQERYLDIYENQDVVLLRIAVPVHSKQKFLGFLLCEMPFEELDVFEYFSRVFDRSYLEILRRGKIIKTVGMKLEGKAKKVSLDQLGLVLQLRIDDKDWLLVREALMKRIFFIFIFSASLMLGFGSFLGKRFFIRRIKNLHAGAKEFTRGNLEHRIEDSGSDELAELTWAFNQLGNHLNKSLEDLSKERINLELKVESRTRELEKVNEALKEKTESLKQKNLDIQLKNLDLEQAKSEIQQKAQDLSRSNRYKSEFLANMTHELRTPLNTLLVLSKLLRENHEDNLNEKEVECAAMIHNASRDLLGLINDLLDLSRIEAGKLDLDIQEITFLSVKEYLEILFLPYAEKKGLFFQIILAEDLPESIQTDGTRLKQILKNLISNAIKFTEKGKVFLEISRDAVIDPSQLENNFIIFDIIDTGIGIEKNKQEVIFESFIQGDGSSTRIYGGTGLGLALAKEFSKHLKGEIQLESEIDKGSSFKLILPEKYLSVS